MDQSLEWLSHTAGLPVPAGFTVYRSTPEQSVREAYEQLQLREKTHYVAVRGPTHALLNIFGPDRLIHTLRRLWSESPEASLLVQRMVPSIWCGKAEWHGKELTITANEGMMVFDPDIYVDGRITLSPKQRKMIRHVDGTTKIIELQGMRQPMPADYLEKVKDLAALAGSNITWAIDDLERIWVLSRGD